MKSPETKIILSIISLAAVLASIIYFVNERVSNASPFNVASQDSYSYGREPYVVSNIDERSERTQPITWNTYTNDDLGIQFKYPDNFFLAQDRESDEDDYKGWFYDVKLILKDTPPSGNLFYDGCPSACFNLFVSEKRPEDNQTLEILRESTMDEITERKDLIIDGNDALLYKWQSIANPEALSFPEPSYVIKLYKDDKEYHFTFTYNSRNYLSKYYDDFIKMGQSIVFTRQ